MIFCFYQRAAGQYAELKSNYMNFLTLPVLNAIRIKRRLGKSPVASTGWGMVYQ